MNEGAGILSQVVGVLSISKQLDRNKKVLELYLGVYVLRIRSDPQGEDATVHQNRNITQEEAELQKEVMSRGLDTVWRVGKLLLEERLRTVESILPGVRCLMW